MAEVLRRECIYLWYYFDVQFRQIFWYWVLGIRHFLFYLVFVMVYSFLTGVIVNLLVSKLLR